MSIMESPTTRVLPERGHSLMTRIILEQRRSASATLILLLINQTRAVLRLLRGGALFKFLLQLPKDNGNAGGALSYPARVLTG